MTEQDAADDSQKYWQDFARAEFAALRAEIDRRSTAQQGVLVLYVTGSGIALGASLQGRLSIVGLLALPFVALAAATLFVDHHGQISRIGAYISKLLAKADYDSASWKNWERWSKDHPPPKRWLRWRFGPYLVFLGSSVACVIAVGVQAFNFADQTALSDHLWEILGFSLSLLATAATWHTMTGLRRSALSPEIETPAAPATPPVQPGSGRGT